MKCYKDIINIKFRVAVNVLINLLLLSESSSEKLRKCKCE